MVTGEGRVFGRRVAVVACEFDFLAGSIGVAAAERITAAVQRATAERLPLLASPSSGGTRMQEGTVAFLQMVKIAAAVELHKRAHLPYLVYLRHPTTGGVFASWGSLGHITVAEPGALDRVSRPARLRAPLRRAVPGGHPDRGEPAAARRHRRRRPAGAAAQHAGPRAEGGRRRARAAAAASPQPEPLPDVPAWESVVASRRPDRPGVAQLLRHGTTERVLLSGTGPGEAATTLLALARFGGQPAVVLGQQRVVGGARRPGRAARGPPRHGAGRRAASCRWCW